MLCGVGGLELPAGVSGQLAVPSAGIKTVGAYSRMKTAQCSIALNREDASDRLF